MHFPLWSFRHWYFFGCGVIWLCLLDLLVPFDLCPLGFGLPGLGFGPLRLWAPCALEFCNILDFGMLPQYLKFLIAAFSPNSFGLFIIEIRSLEAYLQIVSSQIGIHPAEYIGYLQ